MTGLNLDTLESSHTQLSTITRSTFTTMAAGGDAYECRDTNGEFSRERQHVFTLVYDNALVLLRVAFTIHEFHHWIGVKQKVIIVNADGEVCLHELTLTELCNLLEVTNGQYSEQLKDVLAVNGAVRLNIVASNPEDLATLNNVTGFNVQQLLRDDKASILTSMSSPMLPQDDVNFAINVNVVQHKDIGWLAILRRVRTARAVLDRRLGGVQTFADVVDVLGVKLDDIYVDAEYLLVNDMLFKMDEGRPLLLSFSGIGCSTKLSKPMQMLEQHVKRLMTGVNKRQAALAQLVN